MTETQEKKLDHTYQKLDHSYHKLSHVHQEVNYIKGRVQGIAFQILINFALLWTILLFK
jgi:hypothetical protein